MLYGEDHYRRKSLAKWRGQGSRQLTQRNKENTGEQMAKQYTVQNGDTYYSIAQSQLGDGNRYKEIEQLNPNVPENALPVNQPINVPEK
jgi:LysM repeat protein